MHCKPKVKCLYKNSVSGHLRAHNDRQFLNVSLSVLLCSKSKCSSKVSTICGGSFSTNNGANPGNTSAVNFSLERVFDIAKTLGKINGIRCISFICVDFNLSGTCYEYKQTSSSSEGNNFLSFKLSENLSRTPVKPFIKATFSSCGLAAKVERSRKFRVEIGNDEKKGADGRVVVPSRECAFRVIRLRRSSGQCMFMRTEWKRCSKHTL